MRNTDTEFACPGSYLPCIDDFGSKLINGYDFVVCYDPSKAMELQCPITSIVFNFEGQQDAATFEKAASDSDETIYFSRKVL